MYDDKMSDKAARDRMHVRQMCCIGLLTCIFCLALVMQCFTLVAGYCYSSNATTIPALPHAIFLLAPFVLVFFGLVTYRFDITPEYQSIKRNCYVMIVLCALCAIAYVVLFVFSMIEVIDCQSTFCTSTSGGSGYLIAEIIAEGVFVLLFLLQLYWTWMFKNDFVVASGVGSKQQHAAASAQINIRASLLKK